MSVDLKVSIIIPNYNSEKYILETIESVIKQTHTNWELIIVDDRSTDSSWGLINRISEQNDKIKVFQVDKNYGGPAGPRNVGVKNSSGHWIAFLDSDDIWHSRKLEYQLKIANQFKIDFLSTHKENFNEVFMGEKELIFSEGVNKLTFNDLIKKNLVNTSSVLLKKSCLEGLSFNEGSSYVAVEDFDLWLKVLSNNKTLLHISILETVYYRITDVNISKQKIKMAKKVFNVQKQHSKNKLSLYCNFLNYAFKSILLIFRTR